MHELFESVEVIFSLSLHFLPYEYFSIKLCENLIKFIHLNLKDDSETYL